MQDRLSSSVLSQFAAAVIPSGARATRRPAVIPSGGPKGRRRGIAIAPTEGLSIGVRRTADADSAGAGARTQIPQKQQNAFVQGVRALESLSPRRRAEAMEGFQVL